MNTGSKAIYRMKRFTGSAILVFIFLSDFVSAQTGYVFNKITNKDGLSYSTVHSMVQDANGAMWIATKQGLNRFNGYDIQRYYKEDYPAIPSNFCSDLVMGPDGILYIGTGGGLASYNGIYDTFASHTFGGKHLPSITKFLETGDSSLLIGTIQGLYSYFPSADSIARHDMLANQVITSMCRYKENQILIGTNEGIYIAGNDFGILTYFRGDKRDGLTPDRITVIYRDQDGEVWIGTENAGLLRFTVEDNSFIPAPLSGNMISGSEFIRAISDDGHGNLWVGTEAGVFILSKSTKQALHIQQSLEDSEYHLNDNAIYCLFPSRENIMWIGTYFGGVNYTLLENRKQFIHIYSGNESNELRGKAVNKIFKSSDGKLWIATEDGGVCKMDTKEKKILEYYQYQDQGGLSSNNIHAIAEDKFGRMWFGHFKNGIDILDPRSKQITHLLPNPNFQSFTYNSVYALCTDSKQRLWIGTRENVMTYDFEEKTFVPFKPSQFKGYFIYNIMEDRRGKIWFCTRQSGIISYDPESDKITHYRAGPENGKNLSSDLIISSLEDSNGRIWFGTMEGGVNVYHPGRDGFEIISVEDGLPNNTIYGILEENEGVFWFSSNRGLTRYNHAGRQFKNYTLEDGLAQLQFNYNSYFKDENGLMYFGHIAGLTYFDPADILENTVPPNVVFTDFKLFNNSIKAGPRSIIKKHINETDYIKLNHKQNVFTISFVAINYLTPGKNDFFYYLEGFQDEWIQLGNKTSVSYTNISPGTYTFRVKAKNNDGFESPEPREMVIEILPPWWQTPVAYISYAVLIIVMLILFRKFTIISEKEKAALKFEDLERAKIKDLNQQRMNFFTYISHEFKTPISIIVAGIEDLLQTKAREGDGPRGLGKIKRSAKRLSFLIDQLMDFRKIESSHAKLELQQGDLVTFLEDTCSAFKPVFSSKDITFEFHSNTQQHMMWFDPDKIEKIVTNLISNAIKYTPHSGKVRCEILVDGEDKSLEIRIIDNGEGIRKEELKHIFDQFHRDLKNKNHHFGTGIGLTLVKSLVEYLEGNIRVRSTPGVETVFSVELPANFDKIPNVKIKGPAIRGNKDLSVDHLILSTRLNPENRQSSVAKDANHLLIVEDTIDLANILVSHYSRNYRVSFAENGLEAIKLIKQEQIDLIITDIMMPDMNGIELCTKVKADRETSHIAVILLTAKVTQEDRLEGLRAGAEAYISKPFDLNELDLCVRNFLEVRKTLKNIIIHEKNLDLKGVKLHDKDKEFIEKVTQLINENIDNESFTIESMAAQLGFSKTLIYLKHKKLLNVSAKEYLQIVRFKKAIEYMQTTDYNISEIAYRVGFSDPNYFSRAFKKVYKVTPTEYKQMYIDQDQVDAGGHGL